VRFQLRDGTRVIAIERSPFIVGRAPSCSLRIDEVDVAPRHALFRIDGNQLHLHDMAGGANVTRVNGTPVDGDATLGTDDVVSIGAHELVVEVHAIDQPREIEVAITQKSESGVGDDPVALRLAVTRRALAVASPAQAVGLMTTQLERFEADRSPHVTHEELGLMLEMAVRLISETGNERWFGIITDAHRHAERTFPGDIVDTLFSLAAHRKLHRSTALDQYVEALRARVERLSPPERFVLQRLSGLRDRLRT
jgi:pSer/pThr/pTyr-binding forkhead associated (FHA) protein